MSAAQRYLQLKKLQGLISRSEEVILIFPAKDAQERELDGLQEYAESRGFEDDIKIYDIDFFKRKQRRTMLG